MTRGLWLEIQQQLQESRARSMPNKTFRRTKQSLTIFASAKTAPLCFTAELRRHRYVFREYPDRIFACSDILTN